MKEKIKKARMISKITAQVTEYYLENGAENFHIKIDKENNEYTIHTFGYMNLHQKK